MCEATGWGRTEPLRSEVHPENDSMYLLDKVDIGISALTQHMPQLDEFSVRGSSTSRLLLPYRRCRYVWPVAAPEDARLGNWHPQAHDL